MLTEIISKTVADKTVDSILKRIERAVPVPEPGDGGFDAAMRQAFNMGAACMAAQIKNGPVPTKRIALMGEVARVACRARLVGMECRVVVDDLRFWREVSKKTSHNCPSGICVPK